MTHRLSAAEYRKMHDKLGQMAPVRPGVAATPAALARLKRNAADPVKARKRKAPLGRERDTMRAITDYLSVELGPEGRGWFRLNVGEAEREGRRN